jgi:hypothetical protein
MMRYAMILGALALGALGAGCTVESNVDDTYLVCIDDSDCDADNQCFHVDLGDGRMGDFCSNDCADDFDCDSFNGFQSACYSLFGDPTGRSICYERCVDDFDCSHPGFVCTTATMGGVATDAICIAN